MPEFDFEQTEAWKTALRLATSVGRLKIGSNLKAADEAHSAAYTAAGRACALIAQGSTLEGGLRSSAYREGRSELAQCAAWLQILASLLNEAPAVFGEELGLADRAAHQLAAAARVVERGPGGPPRFDRPRGPGPGSDGRPDPRGPAKGPMRGPGPRLRP